MLILTKNPNKHAFIQMVGSSTLCPSMPANMQVVAWRNESKNQWNKLVHEKILEFDRKSAFPKHAPYRFGTILSNRRNQYGQESNIFAHD
jgi:hypothetical protein